MPDRNQPSRTDDALRSALEKAYASRARLFQSEVQKQRLRELCDEVKAVSTVGLSWDRASLGISDKASEKVSQVSIPAHLVFCHPEIITERPGLVRYYRLLAALSDKGLGQLVAGTTGQERVAAKARAVNTLISAIIEDAPAFSLEAMRDIMLAEVGSGAQGTWVNLIGKGATQRVRAMFEQYAEAHRLREGVTEERATQGGKTVTRHTLRLNNGWRIVFSPEPDVGIYDPHGKLECAIEIKGSMDKAGAQTRYGEAKKSFQKALRASAQCVTIYLASCFTTAVLEQIKADQQVRKTYNLIEVLDDPAMREGFLREIFHYIMRIV